MRYVSNPVQLYRLKLEYACVDLGQNGKYTCFDRSRNGHISHFDIGRNGHILIYDTAYFVRDLRPGYHAYCTACIRNITTGCDGPGE